MPQHYVELGPSEIIAERPFTDPVDSLKDLDILQYMLDRLGYILERPGAVPEQPRPYLFFAPEADNRYHRIAVAKLKMLMACDSLQVVGFCGRKRPEADRRQVDAIDEQLIAEFPQHPYLLSYSTMQLTSGNACNLVLFSKRQGLAHWSKGDTHAQAVEMSPQYYTRIRLHNALLPGGLRSKNQLILLRTKYFDYKEDTIWAAIRDLEPPQNRFI